MATSTKANKAEVEEQELPEELPESTSSTSICELVDIGLYPMPERLAASRAARGLSTPDMFKVVFKPLNYDLDINPAYQDEGPYDANTDWHFVFTNDGMLMGSNSTFGQVKAAFQAVTEAAGEKVVLTKNSIYQPKLIGKIFEVETGNDPYVRRNPDREDGKWVLEDGETPDEAAIKAHTRNNYFSIPVGILESYTPPSNRRVQRRGYGGGGGVNISATEVTEEQEEALKEALHGKSEDEYSDALFESDRSDILMVQPFLNEAATKTELTARAKALGAKIRVGRVFFDELDS